MKVFKDYEEAFAYFEEMKSKCVIIETRDIHGGNMFAFVDKSTLLAKDFLERARKVEKTIYSEKQGFDNIYE